MTARVVLDRVDWWETENRIKVECLECGVEWGWAVDKRGLGNYDRLQGYADTHNEGVHSEAETL